ncbi:ATP-binding protein [Halobacteria archaeon AArc-m2/3/4]|uniref:ATP-binding protein n=1 Tax=Natronoglomus mannanivorans TaxID=2979990 RepID=A0AAP2YVU0_9EURY|nr:ATP-binding protein [Halobacteria archaeon AArc-xg1-1]MCU4971425.1 ATP-binding protein [Halobacteria archaeon AArc-m2/3/4]
MSFVIGRGSDAETVQAGRLGRYRALDGSEGAELFIDLDGPHAMLIVGKRGYGKSFTLGVVAEELARAPGVAPVIVDPMGVFGTLADPADGEPVPVELIDDPTIAAATLDPRSWCSLLGLSPESGAGGLVWQAAQESRTLEEMCHHIESTDAPSTDKRAAVNHVDLAASWGVFDPDGLDATELASTAISVVDVSGLDVAPMNAVCRGIGEALYRARIDDAIDRLPWLLIDEAHTFFDGVAEAALHTILTRGRAPGVSLVLATQRPSAVSETAISQSDVLISHRLTAEADLNALDAAQPTYMNESLDERLPTDPGQVVVIDDATETIHAAQIRFRDTPHGGESPSAREIAGLE